MTLLSVLSGILVFAQGVAAQDSSPGSDAVLEEVVVRGIRGSVLRSLEAKRDAVGVQDSISAEDIGKFPDLNLSESLQRVPGVTLTRTRSGEGSRINVRGLGPQFSRVEINGVSGSTSNSAIGGSQNYEGGRGFNFELLASELFQYAVVSKSPMASQTEGGLAGLVELETPRPLAYEDLKLSASVQGNWGEASGTVDPRTAVFVSGNVDDRFGIAASIAYSENTFQTNAVEFASFIPVATGGGISQSVVAGLSGNERQALIPGDPRLFSFIEDRDTLGSTLTLQYRPSAALELSFDSIYARQDGTRTDDRPDIPIEGFPWGDPGFDDPRYVDATGAPVRDGASVLTGTVSDGVYTTGYVENVKKRIGTSVRPFEDELMQFALKADWQPNESWRVTPHIGYSRRETQRRQDLLSFHHTDGRAASWEVVGKVPRMDADNLDFSPEDADKFDYNVMLFFDRDNEDEEISYKLDLERYFEDSALSSFQFGVRYAETDFQREAVRVVLGGTRVGGGTGQPGLAPVARSREFDVSGAGGYPDRILAVDHAKAMDLHLRGQDPFTSTDPAFSTNAVRNKRNSYEVSEDTLAGYLQGNFAIGDLRLNAGLRVVHTDQTSRGSQIEGDGSITPIAVKNQYTEFLPALNLRYNLTDELVLRAAYSRALTRPPLKQLAPNVTILSGTKTGVKGNPDLNPYTANQFDVGLEWYFAEAAVASGTVFVKDIDSLVESSTLRETLTYINQHGNEVTDAILFSAPINGDKARIQGFEVQLQTPLYFLGGLDNLGALINYTFADSKSHFIDQAGTNFTTSLEGLSEQSLNATLYYDDGSLDARVSWAWRDEFLANRNDDFGVPRFEDDFGQLDFSASYRFNDNYTLQVQVTNILDEQLVSTTSNLQAPYGVTELERRIIFGARYSF
jgi:TonB-dependent receptor